MQKRETNHTILVILSLLAFIEIGVLNQWLDLNIHVRTILFYLSGLAIAMIPLVFNPTKKAIFQLDRFSQVVMGLVVIVFIVHQASLLFATHTISIEQADMLPVIEVMGRRWLDGESVYSPIAEIWGSMQPIYLPAMWLPYSIPILFGLDIRWAGLTILVLGFSILFFSRRDKVTSYRLLALAPLVFLFHTIFFTDWRYLTETEEPIVAGYFLWLIYAIYKDKPISVGIIAGFCLLSRYSLIGWLPLLILVNWTRRKYLFKLIKSLILCAIVLMFITGGFQGFTTFLQLPNIYETAVSDPSLSWKYRPVLEHSLGLAKYFGIEQIGLLSIIFKIQLMVLPIILGIVYWRYRPNLDAKLYLLCSLKLILVFFYGFIIIPYKYLFFTSVIFSIGILMVYFNPVQYPERMKA